MSALIDLPFSFTASRIFGFLEVLAFVWAWWWLWWWLLLLIFDCMVLLNLLNDCGVNESSLFFGRVALVGGLGRKTCSLNYKLCVFEVKLDFTGGLYARLMGAGFAPTIEVVNTGLCLNYYCVPVKILFRLLFRFSRKPYYCCYCCWNP